MKPSGLGAAGDATMDDSVLHPMQSRVSLLRQIAASPELAPRTDSDPPAHARFPGRLLENGGEGVAHPTWALDGIERSILIDPPAPWYERHRMRLSFATYERVKRIFDVAVCLLLLPLIIPVLVPLVLAIRLESSGPAFFTQLRTGRGGRRFRMFKLRTMLENSEELKEKYAHLNELTWPDFKITNDPRVTRVGRFLRRTSLDELPQIFNVLRGDMSLVGPRPTSFGPETYTLWHTARLDVTPGLTGLWQVSGRSALDFDERLRLDIAYIRNRCLSLDLEILLRTFGAVSSGRGAS